MGLNREKVLEKIYGLGSTADEVAETLIGLGIKGEQDEPDNCPMARWAKYEFGQDLVPPNNDVAFGNYVKINGEDFQTAVIDGVRLWKDMPVGREIDDFNGMLPQQIWDFIERYDQGVYTDLIEDYVEEEEEDPDLDDDEPDLDDDEPDLDDDDDDDDEDDGYDNEEENKEKASNVGLI